MRLVPKGQAGDRGMIGVEGSQTSCRMMPFERFGAWQRAHYLALDVYKVSARWPVQERYGLISQARRAAYSIPSNIAEGSARRGSNEFARFLYIAVGSISELTYLLYLARDLRIPERRGMVRPRGAKNRHRETAVVPVLPSPKAL